jgi:NAD(P)-dependent dehydrogenase (short-subunit alcohol dehydrogenase family)
MFQDKVVVITGAGSGIGRALALQLAAAGARLALSDVNRAGLDETMTMLAVGNTSGSPPSPAARAYTLDVSSAAAVFAHADDVKRDFGAVHYVFNNAGATIVGTVVNTSIEEFEWQIGINMWGVLYGTKAFLPLMLEQREGCIVNISSVFGLLAFPTQGAYNMSKFAVRGLTECLWSELEGTGVRAVCVHPGGIKTNIEKAGRRVKNAGKLEEKVSAVFGKVLLTPPDECAANIIKGVRRGDRRIVTGHNATKLFWIGRLFPNAYPALVKRML